MATSFTFAVVDNLGRTPLLIFCNILSGLACIAAAIAEEPAWVIGLTLAGKINGLSFSSSRDNPKFCGA